MEEKFYELSLLGYSLAWLLRFTPLDTTRLVSIKRGEK